MAGRRKTVKRAVKKAVQRNPGGGFGNRTLTSGTHTFDLEFQPITGGQEARIQQARLEFWSVT